MISDWWVFPSPESRTRRATESDETCSDHGFLWIPQNNSWIFRQIRAACERTCTVWRITAPPKAPSVQLWRYLHPRECMQITRTRPSKRHTSRSHRTPRSASRSCQPHARTHATAMSIHAIISYLFKTPNTFAHIFTNACFHRPQLGGQVERSGVRMAGRTIREVSGGERRCSGQLQQRTTEWLRSGWCRPSHILRGFLKQTTQKTTRFSHRYAAETYTGLNVRYGWKTAITENHFTPTFSGLLIYCLSEN